jgi:hypothetical protein
MGSTGTTGLVGFGLEGIDLSGGGSFTGASVALGFRCGSRN